VNFLKSPETQQYKFLITPSKAPTVKTLLGSQIKLNDNIKSKIIYTSEEPSSKRNNSVEEDPSSLNDYFSYLNVKDQASFTRYQQMFRIEAPPILSPQLSDYY